MMARWSTAAAIVAGAALFGFVGWIVGLKGLANRAESMCYADTDNHPGHGAFRMRSELWVPSFECRLSGNSVDQIVVQHRVEAIAAFGWVVVVPVVYAIVVLAVTFRWARQTRPLA